MAPMPSPRSDQNWSGSATLAVLARLMLTVPPLRDLPAWWRPVDIVRLARFPWLGYVPFPLGAVGRHAAHARSLVLLAHCGIRCGTKAAPSSVTRPAVSRMPR